MQAVSDLVEAEVDSRNQDNSGLGQIQSTTTDAERRAQIVDCGFAPSTASCSAGEEAHKSGRSDVQVVSQWTWCSIRPDQMDVFQMAAQ